MLFLTSGITSNVVRLVFSSCFVSLRPYAAICMMESGVLRCGKRCFAVWKAATLLQAWVTVCVYI